MIQQISKLEAADKISQAKDLAAWIEQAPILEKRGEIRVFNLYRVITNINKFKFTTDKKGQTVVDHEKSRPEFSEMSDEEFYRNASVAQKVIEIYFKKIVPQSDPARIKIIYGDRFNEFVDSVIQNILARKKIIENDHEINFLSNWPGFKSLGDPLEIKALFSGDIINPEAIQNLNSTFSRVSVFMTLSTDEEIKKLLATKSIDVKKVYKEMDIENTLKDRILKQQDVLEGKVQSVASKCKEAYIRAQEVLPSEMDIFFFRQRIDKIKKHFYEQTKDLICEKDQENYKKFIYGMKVNLPLSKKQFVKNMNESLARELEVAKKMSKKHQDLLSSRTKDIYFSISVASTKKSFNEGAVSINNLCNNLMTEIVPDGTIFSNNAIIAGPLVIKQKNRIDMTYHELGHQLFYYLKSKSSCDQSRFQRMRACLFGIHSEFDMDQKVDAIKRILHGEIAKLEEEDFADMISAKVSAKESNNICQFSKRMYEEEYESLNFKQTNPKDTHSSDLFRLLHVHFLKNQNIPDSCSKALSLNGGKHSFKNCFQ